MESKSPKDEASGVWQKHIQNLPLETIEALEELIKKRLDTFYAAKSQEQMEKLRKRKKVQ